MKYGILDGDFYNFNEIGFIIEIIYIVIVIISIKWNSKSKVI